MILNLDHTKTPQHHGAIVDLYTTFQHQGNMIYWKGYVHHLTVDEKLCTKHLNMLKNGMDVLGSLGQNFAEIIQLFLTNSVHWWSAVVLTWQFAG